MTKKFNFWKRTFNALFASMLVFGLMFVSGCGNDDETEPEPYEIPGIYTFAEAILQTPVTIPLPVGDYTLPAGTNITAQMAGGLLASAGCDNSTNGAVDLKSDNTLWFTCLTETTAATQAGTWALNTAKDKLTLNLSIPAPLSLSIGDLVINENTGEISGTIDNFPLTPDLLAGFLVGIPGLTQEDINAILADLPPATLVTVDITFDKES